MWAAPGSSPQPRGELLTRTPWGGPPSQRPRCSLARSLSTTHTASGLCPFFLGLRRGAPASSRAAAPRKAIQLAVGWNTGLARKGPGPGRCVPFLYPCGPGRKLQSPHPPPASASGGSGGGEGHHPPSRFPFMNLLTRAGLESRPLCQGLKWFAQAEAREVIAVLYFL